MNNTRRGQKRFDCLAAKLNGKDIEIIKAVDRFKILSSKQIERIFFIRSELSVETNKRSCRRILFRLSRDNFLLRSSRDIGGQESGSQPYIYRVGLNGEKLLGFINTGFYRKELSSKFIDHTLEIAEIFVRLIEKFCESVIDFQTEPYCWRYFMKNYMEKDVLKPDIYLKLKRNNDYLFWFVEVDRGTVHSSAIIKKIDTYIRYYYSELEQIGSGVFPKVLWVVPNNDRKDWLQRKFISANKKVANIFLAATIDRTVEVLFNSI